jgi:hypothetical protein
MAKVIISGGHCDELFLAKPVRAGLAVIFHLAHYVHVPSHPVVRHSVADPAPRNAWLVAVVRRRWYGDGLVKELYFSAFSAFYHDNPASVMLMHYMTM